MTSQSLKNHPTTAPLKATRSETRSLWKRFLTGALCLCIAGSIPANDREGGKPLDRLKQRSARQRWRELRGEMMPGRREAPSAPAGQTPSGVLPPREVAPFSTPMQNPTRPLPVPEAAVEVPDPKDEAPEVVDQVSTRSSAKPPVDIEVSQQHPGSFGDVILETRAGSPRERDENPLPHWPFRDDLDLVGQAPFLDASDVTDASGSSFPQAASTVVATPSNRRETNSWRPKLKFPVQVVQVPGPDAGLLGAVDDSIPPGPPASETPAPAQVENESVRVTDSSQQLTSIHDIQPFYGYTLSDDSNPQSNEGPSEIPLEEQGTLDRNHSMIPVYWQASNVYHNPLYFEDPGLERTGHTFSDLVQPFVSVGRFGAQVVALPYAIALDPVCKRETPLGHYRPGECAPKRHLAVPINGAAAATAAAAYTGIIFLIP